MLWEISGEITPERMKGWSQSKSNTPVVDVTGVGSKAQCCKEQYCIGTWNVWSMNQGKLEVVRRWQTGDAKCERQHSRTQQTKMDWNG